MSNATPEAPAFVVSHTPHREKLRAALVNPKAKADVPVLTEALKAYESWIKSLGSLKTTGRKRVDEMVKLLNEYKDYLEVNLILEKGSPFLTRQKGQLKLDNSVLEEFLVHLVRPEVIENLPTSLPFVVGPQTAFMSLAFMPVSFASLFDRPDVVIKSKDQDFVLGANVHFAFSSHAELKGKHAVSGSFTVAAMAA